MIGYIFMFVLGIIIGGVFGMWILALCRCSAITDISDENMRLRQQLNELGKDTY